MPKLFPISLEVEEVALGRVLRALNVMPGVVRLNLNLLNQQRQAIAPNAPEPPEEREEVKVHRALLQDGRRFINGPHGRRNVIHNNPAYKTIAEVLLKTPAHFKILAAAVERNGIRGTGIHGYLRRMKDLKQIKKTGPGSYRLTEKGEKTYFSPKKEGRFPQGSHRLIGPLVKDNHSGVRALVLDYLVKNGTTSSHVMSELLEKEGYSQKNLSTTGMKMRNEGLIEFNEGLYSITEEGQEVFASRPQPETQSPQEEGIAANG